MNIIRNKLTTVGVGERKYFIATIGRKGKKLGYKDNKYTLVDSLLIKDIKNDDGEYISDHMWIKYSRQLEQANIISGDIIKFRAAVKPYIKQNKLKDYGFCYISKVEVIKKFE
jgi:hypothetical protein